MRQQEQQPLPQESIFGSAFNLHPLDSLTFLQATHQHLKQFALGFKERIQAEIQYSKSLIKVGKMLAKHINPARPSPISYISSAFKVEHELRARHALQLAQYLHTQIQIPCGELLEQTEMKLKQITQDLKRQYKQGQNVEQAYIKNLKKYHRSCQDWQERRITKTIIPFLPGTSQNQIEKAYVKLLEEKEDNAQFAKKYLTSLEAFNKFAQKFNDTISSVILVIEKESRKQLSLQSNSLRKLIVSEINMFKNIEYDMINISKQMESVKPNDQLQIFLQEHGPNFVNPIISIYQNGPILENNWHSIDFKYPITRSLLEETLNRIQAKHFNWMLQNKHNSTLRYALVQAWKKFQGLQAQNFMEQLEECVINNKTVRQIPVNSQQKQCFLNTDEAFSVSFSIVTNLASFIRPLELTQNKQTQIIGLLRNYLSSHHFYRFFAATSLEQFLNLRQNILKSKIEEERLVLIIKLLIEQCVSTKDIFVLRSILAIMFSTQLGPARIPLYTKATLMDNDIWSNNDFWESILFEATYQQISLLPIVSKSQLKEIYLMRQKNIIFSTLATYCHYMIMVGCQLQQVKTIAGRFCHIYNLYDEHQRDLSKMIRSSAEKLAKLTQELSRRKEIENEQQNRASLQTAVGQTSQKAVMEVGIEKVKPSSQQAVTKDSSLTQSQKTKLDIASL